MQSFAFSIVIPQSTLILVSADENSLTGTVMRKSTDKKSIFWFLLPFWTIKSILL